MSVSQTYFVNKIQSYVKSNESNPDILNPKPFLVTAMLSSWTKKKENKLIVVKYKKKRINCEEKKMIHHVLVLLCTFAHHNQLDDRKKYSDPNLNVPFQKILKKRHFLFKWPKKEFVMYFRLREPFFYFLVGHF